MEITRGTIVLVNGTRLGLVTGITRPPGMTNYEIVYQDKNKPPSFFNNIVGLRQVDDEDMSKPIDQIFSEYCPLIVINLAQRILKWQKAKDELALAEKLLTI